MQFRPIGTGSSGNGYGYGDGTGYGDGNGYGYGDGYGDGHATVSNNPRRVRAT